MTAITIGTATATVQPAAAKGQTGFFARAWKAFVQSRMAQAEREIALHRHLLPAQFESAANRVARNDDSLPFAR